jgi:hypothetical protein
MSKPKRFRPLKAKDVDFTITCEPEQISIRGNCSAIDDETDNATEQWIIEQLESGNEWAWCCVKVAASWEGYKGVDYLGGCSYESEESFREPGGYYDDMKIEALDDLNRHLQDAWSKIRTLVD